MTAIPAPSTPATEEAAACPICSSSSSSILAAPRHVPTWQDLTVVEQFSLLVKVQEALAQGVSSFHASDTHGHFHLQLTQVDCAPRLTTGAEDPLLPLIAKGIDQADSVDLAIAFAMDSGVRLIEPWFRDLLQRGGRLRIVVGDYMDVTEPAALRRLSDLEGASVFVFETGAGSFHPKAWLFRAAHHRGAAIVGSSNLSQTALTTGVEWNLHSESAADAVDTAFNALLVHPKTRPLTDDWIETYAHRRRSAPLTELAQSIVSDEPLAPAPTPHKIQQAALAALRNTRTLGHRAGLVVLATGLGKTWLAAFDSLPFQRVLFVAHREEILTQAMSSFRRIRPEAHFGRFDGSNKELHAEILFASIQTIGRIDHLRRFAADAFDYIVMDEFHHAAASSYRALLDHFTPQFLLGLTATPDRSDGADLLPLCGDNLVYHCDLFEGIEEGLLSPFSYFGVPDNVDYAQIPWRSSQFDPTELEAALVTEARAANALEQFHKHREGPAIGFCCSVRHAEFMCDYFAARGLKAVAVHSGPTSAPRTTSLERLGRGDIDILFAVDMFNEGVDVPNIGTVMMLRPTESVIIWLQQLGRGLRKIEGKLLRVIDYIGNHRIFLTKLRALLGAGPEDRSLLHKLELALTGSLSLPPGCSVTYELEAVNILRDLLRPKSDVEDLEAQYRDFRMRHGVRPTAAEIAAMGFDPSKNGHGSWFDFVRDMGDPIDAQAFTSVQSLLRDIERNTRLPAPAVTALQSLNPYQPATEEGLSYWTSHPLLRRHGNHLRLVRPDPQGYAAHMVTELADWRAMSQHSKALTEMPAPTTLEGAQLWVEYLREHIPPLFGAVFNPGNWNSGIVRVGQDLVLLTTLKKGSLASGNHYEDRFLGPQHMQWQSQTKTLRGSSIGSILSGQTPGSKVHLFVRSGKLRNGKAAPFLYCGSPRFVSWEGEKPITVEWELEQAVPRHLWPVFGIAEDR